MNLQFRVPNGCATIAVRLRWLEALLPWSADLCITPASINADADSAGLLKLL
jgi:hypothetical protein